MSRCHYPLDDARLDASREASREHNESLADRASKRRSPVALNRQQRIVLSQLEDHQRRQRAAANVRCSEMWAARLAAAADILRRQGKTNPNRIELRATAAQTRKATK